MKSKKGCLYFGPYLVLCRKRFENGFIKYCETCFKDESCGYVGGNYCTTCGVKLIDKKRYKTDSTWINIKHHYRVKDDIYVPHDNVDFFNPYEESTIKQISGEISTEKAIEAYTEKFKQEIIEVRNKCDDVFVEFGIVRFEIDDDW